jgi:hypothetical protein
MLVLFFIVAMGAQATTSQPAYDLPILSSGDLVEYPFESVMQNGIQLDPEYAGTAVKRLRSVLTQLQRLDMLDGPWGDVRRKLLLAGGLKEDYSTSHAFNDDNHCDLTTMIDKVSFQSNANGAVAQISRANQLGSHIKHASLAEHGPGGSWSTCTNGAHLTPPSDVAHVQFASRIAFKLVWVPKDFDEFVLVDDEGRLLKRGKPTGSLPSIRARRGNYALVKGGKYATVADAIASGQYEKPQVCDATANMTGREVGA